ncbi:MAG: winged helix-turn-helix domain-containing protein [Desulfopila sp.]
MKKHKKSNERQEVCPGYRCRGRIWIEKDGETFVGFGRIVLLERIAEHGSISKAAKSMEMSYKHAWDLVDSMNRNAPMPLVAKSTGGKGGGGAVLTEAGENVIREFHELYLRLTAFLVAETENLHL